MRLVKRFTPFLLLFGAATVLDPSPASNSTVTTESTRWETTFVGKLLSTESEHSSADCSEFCRPPGKCIRAHAKASADLCVYSCIADTWCPHGYLCLCTNGTKCSITSPIRPRHPPGLNEVCVETSLILTQREIVDFKRRMVHRSFQNPALAPPDSESNHGKRKPNDINHSNRSPTASCKDSADCPSSKSCHEGTCLLHCFDNQCPKGFICEQMDMFVLSLNSNYPWFPFCRKLDD